MTANLLFTPSVCMCEVFFLFVFFCPWFCFITLCTSIMIIEMLLMHWCSNNPLPIPVLCRAVLFCVVIWQHLCSMFQSRVFLPEFLGFLFGKKEEKNCLNACVYLPHITFSDPPSNLCVFNLFYSGSDGLLQFLLPNVQRQKY